MTTDRASKPIDTADSPPANSTSARSHLAGLELSEADLKGADLAGGDLTGGDLTAADLTGADLPGADLTDAILEDGAIWDDDTVWQRGSSPRLGHDNPRSLAVIVRARSISRFAYLAAPPRTRGIRHRCRAD
jgi:Pentapeptide repeats (8 copies)